MVDIVGLYMSPPDHAVVLSVDGKTQIQALDRTQPGLPLNPSRIGSRTHDYKRNGTAALYAADWDSAAAVGIEGSAVSQGQEFAPIVDGIWGIEKALLGPAFVGEGILGGFERECDG